MDDETDIISDSLPSASEIINEGEKKSESEYRAVYRKGENIVKVLKDELQTNEMKRLGSSVPGSLVPLTHPRTEDLSETEKYSGLHTVIHQESYNQRLAEVLEKTEDLQELGDLIHLLDRMVDERAVVTDPIVENFNYFGEGETTLEKTLKLNDFCDIESLKKFPDSFEVQSAEASYWDHVEDMYEDSILSVSYKTGLSVEDTAKIFEETSSYIRDIDIESTLYIDELPQVDIFQK